MLGTGSAPDPETLAAYQAIKPDPGWLTVVVEPSVSNHPHLLRSLLRCLAPPEEAPQDQTPQDQTARQPSADDRDSGILLLLASAGGSPPNGRSSAAWLSQRLGRPVVAPDGPVLLASDGSLFALAGPAAETADTAGAWWLHVPGSGGSAGSTQPTAQRLGPRWPVPAWQIPLRSAPPPTLPGPATTSAVPAGWQISFSGSGGRPRPGTFGYAVARHPERIRLLLGRGVPPEAVAQAMSAMPPETRAGTELVPIGQEARVGRGIASIVAGLLNEPVRLVNGVPLSTEGPEGSREQRVFMVSSRERPTLWQPAQVLRYTPTTDGPVVEEIEVCVPPQDGLIHLGGTTYDLGLDWVVEVTVAGLVIRPAGQPADPEPVTTTALTTAPTVASLTSMPTMIMPAITMAAITDRAFRRDRYSVVIGTQGGVVADGVFPLIAGVLTSIVVGTPAPLRLVVRAAPSRWGRSTLQELTRRFGGELRLHQDLAGE